MTQHLNLNTISEPEALKFREDDKTLIIEIIFIIFVAVPIFIVFGSTMTSMFGFKEGAMFAVCVFIIIILNWVFNDRRLDSHFCEDERKCYNPTQNKHKKVGRVDSSVNKTRQNMREFYHALNVACIDVLDCDVPLSLGFDIQRFIKDAEHTRLGFANNNRRIWVDTRLCDLPIEKNIHAFPQNPLHKKSNSGSGYW